MKHRERLIAFTIVFTASACERAAPPTATAESADPLLAAGPAGHFKSFRVPTDDSRPLHITLGSDGNMWFTESNIAASQIGRIDPDGNITEFVIPQRFTSPGDIVSGADRALWFTGDLEFAIGRVTTDGQFTGFAPECDPQLGCSIVPNGIASGPDGNIWFTDHVRNSIGKLVPSTGEFTFYPIPTPSASPGGITVGPDGALWFTEFANKIGRIDVAGNITEFGPTTGGALRITAGPDGNLWFTEPHPNLIGRLDPVTGEITEFPLASPSRPIDIVTGPDGNLWFTEYFAEHLSQITPAGVVTRVQRVKGGPWGIGRGADGAIWVTQIDGNRVGRFTLR